MPIDLQAVPRSCNCRSQCRVEADRPESLQGGCNPAHGSRYDSRRITANIGQVPRRRHPKERLGALRIDLIDIRIVMLWGLACELDAMDAAIRFGHDHIATGEKAAHPGLDGLEQ